MHMIINACIGRLQVCVPDSRGRAEPGSPPTSGICSSKRSRLESGLLAWQPRSDESVCVCVCVRDGGQQTGDHSAQTADEEKDIWQVQVSASLTHARTHARTHTHTHTRTHTRAGGRPLWGSPWPVILSCVYLPWEATHAPPDVQAGERAVSPLYRFPSETHNHTSTQRTGDDYITNPQCTAAWERPQ